MLISRCLFLGIMDDKKRRIERIYRRNYINIPKINYLTRKNKDENKQHLDMKKTKKIIKIVTIIAIAIFISEIVLKAIEPIIDRQCTSMAKSIATKVSNEQASIVMANYNYNDLINVTKDENDNIKMITANMITINKVISEIPILIQRELEKGDNNKFHIKLGSFTGSKLLAGRGPNVEIKMYVVGNIETNLNSEFREAGINQTLHRIYLEVKSDVTILTPFKTKEEQIVNQVLLAEGVIVGNIPNTYYNLDGLKEDNLVDLINQE